MAEHQLPKLNTGVRFPSPAPTGAPGATFAGVTSSVLHVAVETVEPGCLEVTWQLEGPPASVDIGVGPTPDRIDHVHTVTAAAGTSSTELTDLGPGRHFVSVSPHEGGSAVIAADRRVLFEGLQNFRDLGGYATADGTMTRWGRVFRSDALHKLTPADLREFERLGMKSVFDLRSDEERSTHPNPFDSLQLAIVGRSTEAAQDPVDALEIGVDGERMLRDIYIGMFEHSAPLFGRLFSGLLESDGLPAVFHCHAGKDRTGVAAALVLLALHVERDVVLDDYELTARYRRFEHQQDSFERLVARGLSPEAAAGVLTAPRWTMSDALDALEDLYGGADSFLTDRAGLTTGDLDRLRALLTQ
jgi:protein-tyrosine phosphatase